jgi:hypothetical protein
MRLLERLQPWLRTSGDEDDLHAHPDSAFASRLPRAGAEVFRSRFRAALAQARQQERAQMHTLDRSVHVVLAQRGRDDDAGAMDAALADVDALGLSLVSLTWTALVDAEPSFEPAPEQWAKDAGGPFRNDVGMVFFLDVMAIRHAVAVAARNLGLSTTPGTDQDLRVSDGTHATSIHIRLVIAEALWTGAGPLDVITKRTQQAAAELRTCASLLHGLRRRFVDAHVDTVGGVMRIRDAAGGTRAVDHEHIARSIRSAQVGVDSWLSRIELHDVYCVRGVCALIRAPQFLRVHPDALHERRDGHLVVLHHAPDGHLVPLRTQENLPQRWAHFAAEAAHQRSQLGVRVHAFVFDEGGDRGIGFVGDKAASLLLDPAMLQRAVGHVGTLSGTVYARASGENHLVLSAVDNEDAFTRMHARAHQLAAGLGDEPGDSLHAAMTMWWTWTWCLRSFFRCGKMRRGCCHPSLREAT